MVVFLEVAKFRGTIVTFNNSQLYEMHMMAYKTDAKITNRMFFYQGNLNT